jgi:hypothetical protein
VNCDAIDAPKTVDTWPLYIFLDFIARSEKSGTAGGGGREWELWGAVWELGMKWKKGNGF